MKKTLTKKMLFDLTSPKRGQPKKEASQKKVPIKIGIEKFKLDDLGGHKEVKTIMRNAVNEKHKNLKL